MPDAKKLFRFPECQKSKFDYKMAFKVCKGETAIWNCDGKTLDDCTGAGYTFDNLATCRGDSGEMPSPEETKPPMGEQKEHPSENTKSSGQLKTFYRYWHETDRNTTYSELLTDSKLIGEGFINQQIVLSFLKEPEENSFEIFVCVWDKNIRFLSKAAYCMGATKEFSLGFASSDQKPQTQPLFHCSDGSRDFLTLKEQECTQGKFYLLGTIGYIYSVK